MAESPINNILVPPSVSCLSDKFFFSQIGERLGKAALGNIHVYFSGTKYGAKGEISHLNLADSDFNYKDLPQAFKDLDVKGLIICESPHLEEDAALLRGTYGKLVKKYGGLRPSVSRAGRT